MISKEELRLLRERRIASKRKKELRKNAERRDKKSV